MSDLPHRLRAARGYADLTQEQLATKLGINVRTVKRSEVGSRSPKRGELVAVAKICGVPMWFLEEGWNGWRRIDQLGRRALEDLDRQRTDDAEEEATG